MATGKQIQKKGSSHFTPTPATGMFKPRPFAEPVQPETATPEVQTKVELGNIGGDRLAGMQVSAPAPIQAKLTIGAPGDKYEQEADTIAETVMKMPAISAPAPVENPTPQSSVAQAKPISAAIFAQAKPISAAITPVEPVIQMQPQPSESLSEEAGENKKGFIQRRIKVQAAADGSLHAPNSLETQISQSKNSGSPLAPQIRAYMEPRFGADFSSVRVHTDSQAVQMNRDLSAQAFTHGNHIYYGSGKSPGNNHLTAHELTHTIQQGGASKSLNFYKLNSPKIQKLPLEMLANKWSLGTANLYDENGMKVGTIEKDTKVKVELADSRDIIKGGKLEGQAKEMYRIIDVDLSKIKIDRGKNFDDLMEKMWIDANHLSYIGIGGKNQNGDSVIDKIKRVYEILKPYQAIHTKYKKYEKQINSKYWGIFMDISQAITIILKFIPGAEVVGNIISQIRKIIHWGTEFIQLKDQNIRQEVTPLMAAQDGKSLTMVVGEIIEQLKQAWAGEEEEQVIEFEEEQVIEF